MEIEMKNTILKCSQKIKDDRFFFTPNIPEKKLKNVIQSYGHKSNPNDVFLLIDNTAF